MATFTLDLPFHGSLLVIVEEEEQKLIEELASYSLDPSEVEERDNRFAEATSFMYEGGIYVIWLKGLYLAALIHEIVHISWLYCDFFEVKLTKNRHELQAYFVDHVTEKLLQKTEHLEWTIKYGSKEELVREDNLHDEGFTETQE